MTSSDRTNKEPSGGWNSLQFVTGAEFDWAGKEWTKQPPLFSGTRLGKQHRSLTRAGELRVSWEQCGEGG